MSRKESISLCLAYFAQLAEECLENGDSPKIAFEGVDSDLLYEAADFLSRQSFENQRRALGAAAGLVYGFWCITGQRPVSMVRLCKAGWRVKIVRPALRA